MPTGEPNSIQTRWDTIVLLCRLLSLWLKRDDDPLSPPSPQAWEPLIEAASSQLVTPTLGVTLRHRAGIPTDIAEYFDAVLFLNRERNDALLHGLGTTLNELRAVGIQPVLMKGAASIVSGLYPDPAMRMIGDIDLLLPEAQAEKAVRLLDALGFMSLPSDRVNYREHHHFPPQYDSKTGLTVELHIRPLLNRWRHFIDARAMIESARSVSFENGTVLVPGPTHRVIQNIVHNQLSDENYGRSRLDTRQMLELAAMTRRYEDEIDWPVLRKTFEVNGQLAVLQDTLEIAQTLFDLSVRPDIGRSGNCPLRALQAEANRSDVSWLFERFAGAARTQPAILLRVFQPYYWSRLTKALRQEMRGERW